MKPLHVLLISLLTATPLTAILDTNQNTLSDLWEAAHNNQQLLDPQDPDHQPTADPDGDGWTNLEESVAGTDPFSSLSPGGMLRPDLANNPATYGDPINGIPQLITPEAISLTWPTVPGKAYQIQYSADLTPNSWSFLPETLLGSGQNFTITIPLTQNNGSPPDALFWRVSITDLDSDGDTLTNAEEISLTTNPNHPDSDLDGIPDNLDSAPLESATLADPDGLGLSNANLLTGLKANWSFEEATIPFANLFGKNEARCENHAPATTPSWPVLVPLNLSGSSAFQRRGFVSQGLPIADKSIFGDGKIFTGITNSFTLSFWHRFQKDSIKNGSNIYKCLWSLSDCRPAQSSISSNTLAIRKKNATEEEVYLGAYTWTGSGGNPHSTIIGKSFTRPLGTADDGKWHHYTIVRSSGKFTLLIDGVTMPGLNDATVPWLDIPLNKATPTSPSDYTYDWNTFGRMAPNLAHNQTLGTFDRIRLWSRPLTSNETTLLYQEDIDNDGLWDVTEVSTNHWLDINSDGLAVEQEISYYVAPTLWQNSNHDTDADGATDLEEQAAGTMLWNPDTDLDLIPDGWELSVSMNPKSNSDANLDPDQDGATNLEEYRHNTNPNLSNTDGDSKSDGEEINGPDGNPETDDGSDPTDSSDNGVRRPDNQLVFFKLGVGDRSTSQSEDYVLNVFRYTSATTLEERVFTLRSGGFGEYKELIRAFRNDHLYTFQIQWLGSSRNIKPSLPSTAAQKPDFDYHMVVEPQEGSLALIADSFDTDARTHDPNFRILDTEDILPADDNDDNVDDLPYVLTPKRVLSVPLILERDLDVLDDTWQIMSGQLAKALPGQKINLRVRAPMLPSRLEMGDHEWVLPQAAFKDYSANQTDGKLTRFDSDDLRSSSVSFYLSSSGSFPIKMKFALNGNIQEVKANLNVEQPTSNFTTKLGIIQFGADMAGRLRLGLYANAQGDYFGIVWKSEVFVPEGWPEGKWNWVQLGTPDISAIDTAENHLVWSTNGQTGLDTNYPTTPHTPAPHPGAAFGYPTGVGSYPGNSYGDSPSIPLNPYRQCSYVANFTTYLMFLPDGVDSRYVPLRSMSWGVNFSASKDASNSWTIDSQSVNAQPSQPTTEHPQWSINIAGEFVNE
jgi:hypothetical protein